MSPETNNRVALSPEIEAIFKGLTERIETLDAESSKGSVVANESLAVIGEQTKALSQLALKGRTDGLQAVDKMRRTLQDIISTMKTGQNNEPITLTDEQGLTIKRYIEGIGEEPSGSRITDDTSEKKELRIDLPGKGVISLTVFLSGPTVLAWKLDRRKTEKELERLNHWLDRLLDQRSQEIRLNLTESAEFLKTFKIEDEDGRRTTNDTRNIPAPRTFANVVLSDGRKVSVTFSSIRSCDKYIAAWKEGKKP
jgi:hypothetical protein